MGDRTQMVNGTKDVVGVTGVEGTALVLAARNGDRAAGERLAAQYLPLVYNVVGRALNGHPDVDDVVQETMLRALSGLPALRDPARFRSWLVAIAMNQVRSRWSHLGHRPAPLEETDEPADPAADFVDLTILRLELSGQRRETAEATRWLDDAERDVLSLWWLETTGDLTRPELAEALGLSPQHAAVRVQRVKNQLDIGRTVVRALASDPRCPALADLVGDWDGTPTPLWRKRIARHVRGCVACSDGSTGLVPAEGLLSGLALVVPLYDTGHAAAAVATSAAPATAAATGQAASHAAPAAFSAGKAAGLLAGAAAVTALAVLVWPSAPAPPESRGAAPQLRAAARERPRRAGPRAVHAPTDAHAHREPYAHRRPEAHRVARARRTAPGTGRPRGHPGQHPARRQRLPAARDRPPADPGRPAALRRHGRTRLLRPHRLRGPGHGRAGRGHRLRLVGGRRDHRDRYARPGGGRRGVAHQPGARPGHSQLRLHARGRGHRRLPARPLLDPGAGDPEVSIRRVGPVADCSTGSSNSPLLAGAKKYPEGSCHVIVRPVRFVPSKPGATSEVVVRRGAQTRGVCGSMSSGSVAEQKMQLAQLDGGGAGGGAGTLATSAADKARAQAYIRDHLTRNTADA